MNQTQKRLSIINMAISITDLETIQLQISKLRLLENDEKIREIINALESKNYAYSQTLINQYINTPIQTVHQRVQNEKTELHNEKEKELIKKFDLHVLGRSSYEENDLIEVEAQPKKKSSFDSFLNLSVDDILVDNIAIKSKGDDFFEDKKTMAPVNLVNDDIPKDDFFDTILPKEEPKNEPETIIEEEITPCLKPEDPLEETHTLEPLTEAEEQTDESYRPILSIKEQFEAISQKHPPLQNSSNPFSSVTQWLEKIKTEGYTDSEIEEAVYEAMKLVENNDDEELAEATELILLLGCSENKFAKLILARELYKGKLFARNVEDAFSMFLQLANDKYPEALCDLGQFHEYGIGTEVNTKEAKKLYKEAMELGVSRAQAHFKRLKGFFF